MKDIDPQTLFTALAFVAVAIKKKDDYAQDEAERVRQLARYIQEFCAEVAALPLLSDDTKAIDALIEYHIHELREKEVTRLPQDRETLLKLHDRLNIRNLRRVNLALYAEINTSRLADIVLGYLDNEIEEASKGSLS